MKNNEYQNIILEYNTKKNKIIYYLQNELIQCKNQLSQLINKCLYLNKEIYQIKNKIKVVKSENLKYLKYDNEKHNNEKHNNEKHINNYNLNTPVFLYKHVEVKLFKKVNLKNIIKLDKSFSPNLDFITNNEIKQLLLKEKNSKLNEIISLNNKNKPINNMIKCIKKEIINLKLDKEQSQSKIVELRKDKINYYKKLDLQIYNNINNTIYEHELSHLTKSFFFDNIEIYNLINKCNKILFTINTKKKELEEIIERKNLYNSSNMNNLLLSIKTNNNSNNKNILNKCISNKNKNKNKNINSSIIINNEIKYKSFIFTLNNIFMNHLIKTNKINIKSFNTYVEQIESLESRILFIDKVINFKIVNNILNNVKQHYQKKINTYELNKFKQVKYNI